MTSRTLSGFLAGLVLAGALAAPADARTSTRASPGINFDGNWSVLIVTNSGPCDRGYRYGLSIRNGFLWGGQVEAGPCELLDGCGLF